MAPTTSSAPFALRGTWHSPGRWVSRGLRGDRRSAPGPPEAPLFAQQFFEAPLAVPRVGRCASSSHSLLGPQDREAVVSISHSKNSIKIGNHKKVMEALNILSRVL